MAGSTPYARWFAGEKADAARAEAKRQEEANARAEGVRADDGDEGAKSGSKKTKKKQKQQKGDDDMSDDDDSVEEEHEDAQRKEQVTKSTKGKSEKTPAASKAKEQRGTKQRGKAAARGDGTAVPDEIGELHMSDLDSD